MHRYSRARKVDEMFLPSVAVFVTEIIKVVICVAVEIYNEGFIKFVQFLFSSYSFCFFRFCNSFRSHTISQPWDTLKVRSMRNMAINFIDQVCVPAMVYVIQNNLFYIAASHLEAATFMVHSSIFYLPF